MNQEVMDQLREAAQLVDKRHRFAEAAKVIDQLQLREDVAHLSPLNSLLGQLRLELEALATLPRPPKAWVFAMRNEFYKAFGMVGKMSDSTLTAEVTKLASENPGLRKFLVPLLKTAKQHTEVEEDRGGNWTITFPNGKSVYLQGDDGGDFGKEMAKLEKVWAKNDKPKGPFKTYEDHLDAVTDGYSDIAE